MSEFLAEAQVLIIPNTTGFRAQLQTQLVAATKGVVVPVPVTSVVDPRQLQLFSTASGSAAAQQQMLGLETERTNKGLTDQEKRLRASNARLAQAQSGLLATTATMSGLRGAAIGASGPFLAAAVAVTIFGKAVQSAANLETSLNVFRVTAKATADEMERVADTSRRLGADLTLPGVSAGDAATAMTELAKAGLSVQDSLDGARGALQLATAAQLDNATATNLIATALNSFRLNGAEAVRVADLLTGAANESQGSIADMGLALQQAAAVASLAGINVQDTVTILTQLTQAGLKGSDAGTSFRTALIRLINPTKKINAELERLEVDLRDVNGNIRPEVFGELGAALDRLPPAARQTSIAILGGADAIRAFGLLSREGTAAFQETRAAITEEGLAAELAGARTQGFTGQVENLKNQAEALGTSLGQVSIGPLGLFVGSLADAAGAVNTTLEGVRDLKEELAEMGRPLAEIVPHTEKAEGAFSKIAKTAVRLQLLGPTITVASLALERFGDEAEEAAGKMGVFDQIADSVTGSVGRLVDALNRAATSQGRPQALLPSLATQLSVAEAGGEEQEVLRLLREREANQAAFLRRMLARPQTRAVQETVQQAAANLEQTRNEIQGILDGQASEERQAASDAERAANEIARARDAKDKAILDAIGLREDRARNTAAEAAATESIQDDIRANVILRNVFTSALNEIRKTVQDAKTKAAAIANLTRELIAVKAEASRLQEELKQQRQQERQEARERQRESLRLDIEIAQATGRGGAEARAREAEIAFIKQQIRQTRAGSLQRKRLILELRQAQKELQELAEEKKKTNTFAEEAFGFFQKREGFAANLLGNLIPSDATTGLVGGSQGQPPPDSGLNALAAVKASRDQGVTPGQFGQLIGIQSKMLDVLQHIAGRGAHPEAQYQRVSSSGGSAMDVM